MFACNWSNFENVEHDASSEVAVAANNTDNEECAKYDVIDIDGNKSWKPINANHHLQAMSKENVLISVFKKMKELRGI